MKYVGSIGFGLVLVLSIGLGIGACKTSNRVSGGLLDASNPDPLSTLDTLKYISETAANGKWRWVIDKDKYNEEIWNDAHKLQASGDEMFGIPYKDIKVCPGRTVQVEGEEACLTWDNAFIYDYFTGKRVERFNHIIVQKVGNEQPEIEKFLQPGDMIVYFHPEDRSPGLGEDGMQWRASHAATIVKKRTRAGYKYGTVDTPSGYAEPFTGSDTTPFHVFRFMPTGSVEFQDPEKLRLAQGYRDMIAKWASLGFDQFDFASSYDQAAGTLTGPQSVEEVFGRGYLRATTGGESNIPDMYCAWFVFTNLNLAWISPLTTTYLASQGIDMNGEFNLADDRFTFAGSAAKQNYVDDALAPHPDYVFPPFTASELIKGFLDQLVGEDDPAAIKQTMSVDLGAPEDQIQEAQVAEVFCGQAKNKAGILLQMSQNSWQLNTFESRRGYVPDFDQTVADDYNAQLPQLFQRFAGLYSETADSVCPGNTERLAGAFEQIKKAYVDMRRELKTTPPFDDNTPRWIPPYIFGYIANNYGRFLRSAEAPWEADGGRPPLAYIGTVINEKFVACNPSLSPEEQQELCQAAGAGNGDIITRATEPDEVDLENDERMYELVGMERRGDGKGFTYFFECLSNPNVDLNRCGEIDAQMRFSPEEVNGLLLMVNSWHNGQRISEKQLTDRNNFGLDPVKFRRALVSYWNDPMAAFRPNFMEDPSRNLKQNVINFRILFTSSAPIGEAAAIGTFANGKRQSPFPCARGTGTPQNGSCDFLADDGRRAIQVDDPPFASYGDWPRIRPTPEGGSGSEDPAGNAGVMTCERTNQDAHVKKMTVSFQNISNNTITVERSGRSWGANATVKFELENTPRGMSQAMGGDFADQFVKLAQRNTTAVVTKETGSYNYKFVIKLDPFNPQNPGAAVAGKVTLSREAMQEGGENWFRTNNVKCSRYPFDSTARAN